MIIHNVICVHDTNRPIDMINKLKIFEIYELHLKRSTSVSQSKKCRKCRESAPARCRSTVANVSQRVLELGHEGNGGMEMIQPPPEVDSFNPHRCGWNLSSSLFWFDSANVYYTCLYTIHVCMCRYMYVYLSTYIICID